MTNSTFRLMVQLKPVSDKPYWIIEMYRTSEGTRTRVCGPGYKTQEEAESVMDDKATQP